MLYQSARKMTLTKFVSWVVCVPISRKVIRQSKFKAISGTLSWEHVV